MSNLSKSTGLKSHAFTSLNTLLTIDTHVSSDEVYMVPDESSSSEKCPTLPPRNAPLLAPSPDKPRSATLLSAESNVYEDIDSDTDDGRSSLSVPDAFDIYSDTLDETLELESDVIQRGTALFCSVACTYVTLSHHLVIALLSSVVSLLLF